MVAPGSTWLVGVGLSLDAAWPGWVLALAVGGAVALVVWTYGTPSGWSRRTMGLAALRAAAVLGLLLVLARPTLIFSRDYQPRSVLTVAVDTSASMAREDVPRAGMNSPDSRLRWAVAQLTERKGALLGSLLRDHDVQLVAVADRVASDLMLTRREQLPQAMAWLTALKADGPVTDLTAAVQQVLATAPAGQVSAGIVLVSDGRRTAGAPLNTTAEQLASQHCPAIAVPVGSDRPLPDLELADLEAPARVFIGEPVAIRGRVNMVGVDKPAAATVRLVEPGTESGSRERHGVIAQRRVDVKPDGAGEFSLIYRPEKTGLSRLLVKVESAVAEANLRNNVAPVQVEAVDAKIRVLYIEDQARFEYRYLKNLLVREPTIISSCLLLSADPQFPQEGSEPIPRFPETFEQLERYDVVILGDLDPRAGWAGPHGLEDLARWVEEKGGGLTWLMGPRNGLQAWRGTPLGKLLPVQPVREVADSQPAARPYRLVLTPLAHLSPIFLLDVDSDTPGSIGATIDQLPPWQWEAMAGPATPAAEALAVSPLLRTADGPVPLVVTGRYGAGQTLYCGTDDLWRWRRFRDIEHWRSFWLQSIRWLAGPRKLGAHRPISLEAAPTKATVGQPVAFTLQVRDTQLEPQLPERVSVAIRQADGDDQQNLWLQRTPQQAVYTGSIALDRSGSYTAQAQVAMAPAVTAAFTVNQQEAETADTPADSVALRQWAEAVNQAGGEGYTIEMDHLGQLASLNLPRAPVRTRVTEVRPWDNWIALLLVAGLFVAEWAWRRARGLA